MKFRYYDHLLGLDNSKFTEALQWLPETKVCRLDRFGCGEDVHISRFIHRQRVRKYKYIVGVDLICRDCVSKKVKSRRKAMRENPLTDGVEYGLSSKYAHTGPLPGSIESLFFCKR